MHFLRYEAKIAILILLYSLAIRILLSPIPGYKIDLSTFSYWFYTAAEHGPSDFYEAVSWCDYPPLNVYIFWIFGSLAKFLSHLEARCLVYVLKLPSNLFDVATAFSIFVFLVKRLGFRPSIIAASLYAFNPATIFNTSVWGQFDAVYTFFIILSLLLIIEDRHTFSAIAFTMGFLLKPQSIALAPLIAFLIIRKNGLKGLLTSALASAATTLILIIPFRWSNPLDFLVDIYKEGFRGYPYTSVNAFNVWAFHGFWKTDLEAFFFTDFSTIGWVMFGALTALSLYHLYKRSDDTREAPVLFSAFVLLFGFFMLLTRIHERYLFPIFSVLTLMMPFQKKAWPFYGVLTFTYLSNQAYVLSFINNDKYIQNWDPFVLTIASINILAFLYAVILMVRSLRAVKDDSTRGCEGLTTLSE